MFCKNCGAQLDPSALNCANCGAPTGQVPPVFCQRCGTPSNGSSPYCLQCGAPLQNTAANINAKSKMAAGLLAFLVGAFGVHNFYLGYTGKGVAQLLLTILSCGVLSVISYVWAIVDGVKIFNGTINVDANNVPLKD